LKPTDRRGQHKRHMRNEQERLPLNQHAHCSSSSGATKAF
jgi:hypothetical protein